MADLIPLYKAEPPFMAYKSGHGYLGVLLEDRETGKVQCHLCGKLIKNIPKHLYHSHNNLPAEEYRKEVGLGSTMPLVCSDTSKRLRESGWTDLSEQDRERKHQKLIKNNREVHRRGAPASRKNGNNGKRAIQYNNRFGTCEAQARAHFWGLYNKLGRIPNCEEDQKLKYLVFARFDSYESALRAWGVSSYEIGKHHKRSAELATKNRDKTKAHPPTEWETMEIVHKSLISFYKKHKRPPTFGEMGLGRIATRFSIHRKLGLRLSGEIKTYCEKNAAL